jgi:hypothetical protein
MVVTGRVGGYFGDSASVAPATLAPFPDFAPHRTIEGIRLTMKQISHWLRIVRKNASGAMESACELHVRRKTKSEPQPAPAFIFFAFAVTVICATPVQFLSLLS